MDSHTDPAEGVRIVTVRVFTAWKLHLYWPLKYNPGRQKTFLATMGERRIFSNDTWACAVGLTQAPTH